MMATGRSVLDESLLPVFEQVGRYDKNNRKTLIALFGRPVGGTQMYHDALANAFFSDNGSNSEIVVRKLLDPGRLHRHPRRVTRALQYLITEKGNDVGDDPIIQQKVASLFSAPSLCSLLNGRKLKPCVSSINNHVLDYAIRTDDACLCEIMENALRGCVEEKERKRKKLREIQGKKKVQKEGEEYGEKQERLRSERIYKDCINLISRFLSSPPVWFICSATLQDLCRVVDSKVLNAECDTLGSESEEDESQRERRERREQRSQLYSNSSYLDNLIIESKKETLNDETKLNDTIYQKIDEMRDGGELREEGEIRDEDDEQQLANDFINNFIDLNTSPMNIDEILGYSAITYPTDPVLVDGDPFLSLEQTQHGLQSQLADLSIRTLEAHQCQESITAARKLSDTVLQHSEELAITNAKIKHVEDKGTQESARLTKIEKDSSHTMSAVHGLFQVQSMQDTSNTQFRNETNQKFALMNEERKNEKAEMEKILENMRDEMMEKMREEMTEKMREEIMQKAAMIEEEVKKKDAVIAVIEDRLTLSENTAAIAADSSQKFVEETERERSKTRAHLAHHDTQMSALFVRNKDTQKSIREVKKMFKKIETVITEASESVSYLVASRRNGEHQNIEVDESEEEEESEKDESEKDEQVSETSAYETKKVHFAHKELPKDVSKNTSKNISQNITKLKKRARSPIDEKVKISEKDIIQSIRERYPDVSIPLSMENQMKVSVAQCKCALFKTLSTRYPDDVKKSGTNFNAPWLIIPSLKDRFLRCFYLKAGTGKVPRIRMDSSCFDQTA